MFVFAGGLGIPGFFKVRTVTNTKVSIKLNQTPQISFHYIAVPFITIVVLLQAISVAFDRFPDSEDVDLRTWFLWFLYTPVRLNRNSFFIVIIRVLESSLPVSLRMFWVFLWYAPLIEFLGALFVLKSS
jgi:hypothetical protein